jgi:hypothetical protein
MALVMLLKSGKEFRVDEAGVEEFQKAMQGADSRSTKAFLLNNTWIRFEEIAAFWLEGVIEQKKEPKKQKSKASQK